ncbi:MAG TPA: thioredoxin domain-containing protein [Mariprofundaceae bacterium]|nr:thioredoxin domain-containing protein [Mariprofundaceae bacterium]
MTKQQSQGNHLLGESSPYLQQHAHNPVNWYPWGEEAFALARLQDKPVFLSIGYSTCHWCHVMEEESFADAEVAEALNKNFIAIKVDREERPDIDAIYMQAAQTLNGGGGWPLNVLLTPDKQPFYAATYLPKHSRFGRMGIIELAERIGQLWTQDRQRIEQSAASLSQAVRQGVTLTSPGEVDAKAIDAAFDQLSASFDAEHGGFGNAPKFPSPHRLLFLLRYGTLKKSPEAIAMVGKTLDAMQRGGIHDQLGGGFHRYATDAIWLLPHFEKMLYDQAMLLMAYAEGWQVTGDASFAETARGIASYMLRDLRDGKGGFYSAEDADSEGVEGKFYVWSEAEIRQLLGKDADAFIKAYNVRKDGNFVDEATRQPSGENILHLSPDSDVNLEAFAPQRAILMAARDKRIRPFRDDKILADWNGLAIAALASAGRILDDKDMVDAAARAARFVLGNMQDRNGLLHRWRKGDAAIAAHLDDYAAMVWGLTEIYEATLDGQWLAEAVRLNHEMIKRFKGKDGGFYMSQSDNGLIARPMEAFDGALPSGNAMAMHNLLRLSRLTGNADLEKEAAAVAGQFAGLAARAPSGLAHMLSAVLLAEMPAQEIVLAGDKSGKEGAAMLQLIRSRFRPNTVVLWADDGLEKLAPYTAGQKSIEGKATAYVCENFQCNLPVTDIEALRAALKDG